MELKESPKKLMSTWLLHCIFSIISTLILYIVFLIWLDYDEVVLILDDWTMWLVIYLLVWRHAILGMSIGYHRFYSHRAFKAKRWAEFLIAYSCAVSGQGGLS